MIARSHRHRLLTLIAPAVVVGALGLSACGGGGSNASEGSDPGLGEPAAPTSSSRESDPLGAGSVAPAGSDGDPLGETDDREGDGVVFVTNAPTTTTSTTTTLAPTTTRPPTTTHPPTTTTSTTSTTTTSTTTTVPPPTSVRCSFAADALFDPGQAVLHDQAVADLALLAGDVGVDVRSVRVEGRTDHRGSEADNLILSEDRAAAAAEALVAAGIDADLVTTEGLGEREALQPAADHEPTDDEMAADRRVDVLIDADVPISASCDAAPTD